MKKIISIFALFAATNLFADKFYKKTFLYDSEPVEVYLKIYEPELLISDYRYEDLAYDEIWFRPWSAYYRHDLFDSSNERLRMFGKDQIEAFSMTEEMLEESIPQIEKLKKEYPFLKYSFMLYGKKDGEECLEVYVNKYKSKTDLETPIPPTDTQDSSVDRYILEDGIWKRDDTLITRWLGVFGAASIDSLLEKWAREEFEEVQLLYMNGNQKSAFPKVEPQGELQELKAEDLPSNMRIEH